ncbi:hypothetical protein D3C81_2153670 [compost metagenome]
MGDIASLGGLGEIEGIGQRYAILKPGEFQVMPILHNSYPFFALAGDVLAAYYGKKPAGCQCLTV